MSDPFDPYSKWFGIPEGDRPPDHYRLLGLHRFEAESEKIRNALESRMITARRYEAGVYSNEAITVMREIGLAGACLLDSGRKADYDEKLRRKLGLADAETAADDSSLAETHAERPPIQHPSRTRSGVAVGTTHSARPLRRATPLSDKSLSPGKSVTAAAASSQDKADLSNEAGAEATHVQETTLRQQFFDSSFVSTTGVSASKSSSAVPLLVPLGGALFVVAVCVAAFALLSDSNQEPASSDSIERPIAQANTPLPNSPDSDASSGANKSTSTSTSNDPLNDANTSVSESDSAGEQNSDTSSDSTTPVLPPTGRARGPTNGPQGSLVLFWPTTTRKDARIFADDVELKLSEVFVGGNDLYVTIRIPAGNHELRIEWPNGDTISQSFNVANGESARLAVNAPRSVLDWIQSNETSGDASPPQDLSFGPAGGRPDISGLGVPGRPDSMMPSIPVTPRGLPSIDRNPGSAAGRPYILYQHNVSESMGDSIAAISLSRNPNELNIVDRGANLARWNVQGTTPSIVLRSVGEGVGVSSIGRMLVLHAGGAGVRFAAFGVWDDSTQLQIRNVSVPAPASAEIGVHGDFLTTSSPDGLRLYHLNSGNLIGRLGAPRGWTYRQARYFSGMHAEERLAMVVEQGRIRRVRILETTRLRNIQDIDIEWGGSPSLLAMSHSNELLAAALDRTVEVFDVGSGESQGKLPPALAEITCITFTGDNQWLVAGLSDGRMCAWNVDRKSLDTTRDAHQGSVTALVPFSPVGIASGGEDGVVKTWSAFVIPQPLIRP